MSQVSKVDEILQKVFRGGVGFERGQSVFDRGHLKMSPKDAEKALLSIILEALPEKIGGSYDYDAAIDEMEANIKRVFGVEG